MAITEHEAKRILAFSIHFRRRH